MREQNFHLPLRQFRAHTANKVLLNIILIEIRENRADQKQALTEASR